MTGTTNDMVFLGHYTKDTIVTPSGTRIADGASIRGEVSREVLQELSKKDCTVVLDVQGYIRVIRNGLLVHEEWPEMESILTLVDVLKTDAVEALIGSKY